MRILHVSIAYEPAWAYGGPVRSIRNLCLGLLGHGVRVDVCTTDCDGTRSVDVPLNKPVERDGVSVRYFHSPHLRYYGYSPAMKTWLNRHVADYDLVHIHGIYSFPQRYAAAAAREAGIPWIISPRGSADRRLVRQALPLVKWFYLHLANRRAFSGAAAFHYTTHAEMDNSVIGFLDRPFAVIPNAVDTDAFASAPDSEPPFSGAPFLLYTGRLSWKKQLPVLVKAFAAVAQKHPTLLLVIAGPDDEGISAKLAELAREHGLTNRVKVLGLLDTAALAVLYRHATCFVSPSLSENFGHTVVEALACACPVIASTGIDVATLPEIAALVNRCTPTDKAFSLALEDHLAAPEKLVEAASKGPETAKKLFLKTQVSQRMIKFYERFTASRTD
jgi:glycosyltransferase involved in cell wall biosynthesis